MTALNPRREDGDLEHGGHEVLEIERGVAKEVVEGKLLALIATMSRKFAPTFATKSFSPSKDRSRGPLSRALARAFVVSSTHRVSGAANGLFRRA